jgi:hypothetical protein
MGCAASTPGPVAGSESGQAGSHPSSPSATPANGQTIKTGGAMVSAATPAAQGSAKLPVPTSKTEMQDNPSKPTPLPSGGTSARRRQSSEEFAAAMSGPNAEPTFIPVTKGKVSDSTFSMNEDVLRPRNRSQDDAGILAQQLGLMQSSPLVRNGSDFEPGAGRSGTGTLANSLTPVSASSAS